MECPVCFEPYDLERHRPKVLVPCGHSVCLQCLLDPAFGKRCPQDRKPFRGRPAQMPDCMAVINLIGQAGANPRPAAPWCRDCRADFSDHCADAGHAMCSRKRMRTEQTEFRAQALERGVAACTALEEHFEAVEEEVDWRVQACRADRNRLETARTNLRAAAEANTDLKPVVDAAEQLLPRVERLEESASLAGLRGRCTVTVQAEDGAAWRASVALEGGRRHALRLALLELRSDGDLTEDGATDGAVDGGVESLDLTDICRREIKASDIVKLLKDGVGKVRSLSGMNCAQGPRLCELLLLSVAPHLESLELLSPFKEHMEALESMPALRKLTLLNSTSCGGALPPTLEELCIKKASLEHMVLVKSLTSLRKLEVHYNGPDNDALALPLQLEELTLRACSERLLSDIPRMPKLRRLFLFGVEKARSVSFLPPPPHFCGLSRLKLATDSEATVLSLIRAYAATLKEIQLYSSSRGNSFSRLYFPGLVDCLRSTALPELQRLVLLRKRLDWVQPSHSYECSEQVAQLKTALQPQRGEVTAGVRRIVTVLCDICDENLVL